MPRQFGSDQPAWPCFLWRRVSAASAKRPLRPWAKSRAEMIRGTPLLLVWPRLNRSDREMAAAGAVITTSSGTNGNSSRLLTATCRPADGGIMRIHQAKFTLEACFCGYSQRTARARRSPGADWRPIKATERGERRFFQVDKVDIGEFVRLATGSVLALNWDCNANGGPNADIINPARRLTDDSLGRAHPIRSPFETGVAISTHDQKARSGVASFTISLELPFPIEPFPSILTAFETRR